MELSRLTANKKHYLEAQWPCGPSCTEKGPEGQPSAGHWAWQDVSPCEPPACWVQDQQSRDIQFLPAIKGSQLSLGECCSSLLINFFLLCESLVDRNVSLSLLRLMCVWKYIQGKLWRLLKALMHIWNYMKKIVSGNFPEGDDGHDAKNLCETDIHYHNL